MTAWRIDTLDPLAGRAFISWRGATLFADEPLEDTPVFVIGPPDFTPLAVVNRSTALSAERYGFQAGLLDQKGERAFRTADQAAEFVRRLYLAGSRGDPDDGLPSLPEPVPPLDGPPGADKKEPAEAVLCSEAARFLARSSELDRDDIEPWPWKNAIQAAAQDVQSATDLLIEGAALALHGLTTSFPVKGGADALETWRTAGVLLVRALTDMDLLAEFQHRKDLEWAWRGLEKAWLNLNGQSTASSAWRFHDALEVIVILDRLPFASELFWSEIIMRPSVSDPMNDLARLPLSPALAEAIRQPSSRPASLLTLTSVALAGPSYLQQREVMAALLFAACRLASTADGGGYPLLSAWAPAVSVWREKARKARQNQLILRGLAWIEDNLPRALFDPTLEQLIASFQARSDPEDPQGGPAAGSATLNDEAQHAQKGPNAGFKTLGAFTEDQNTQPTDLLSSD